ncbi:MAG: PAS domain S-box protein [Candidatus Synoicihabitans palmerolidicus]|nr:PAS domain S-box protein [Candidatus Synoicihabitans palmerolidicus]
MVQQRTDQLKVAEDRFSEAFNASPLAQCIQTLPEGRIVEVNHAYEALCGLSKAETIGLTSDNFPKFTNVEVWRQSLQRLSKGESIDKASQSFVDVDGQTRHFQYFARRIVINDAPHCLWLFHEVTEQQHLERQLR